ncbi:hypothetical protein [Palleronia pelagia]|uniref:hypothetical protein n=1 Tax=Palleronia pelagia TaxID=387096 RepID=UPI00111400C4|nr:hypothetical protein [Palleronia pelagia]
MDGVEEIGVEEINKVFDEVRAMSASIDADAAIRAGYHYTSKLLREIEADIESVDHSRTRKRRIIQARRRFDLWLENHPEVLRRVLKPA